MKCKIFLTISYNIKLLSWTFLPGLELQSKRFITATESINFVAHIETLFKRI